MNYSEFRYVNVSSFRGRYLVRHY